jgi:putative two-component system response regulator
VADLVEFRDKSTGGHIMRTTLFLKTLINGLKQQGIYTDKIAEWNIDFVLLSAQLHDVGKIAIPDSILNKPGKLTPEEFEIMKTHVTVGVDALERIMHETKTHVYLDQALLMTETHHEKWDGSGYPMGLKGADIPLEGRLMAIVDVYDALISDRSYKKALSHEEASRIVEAGSGTHFDPQIVDVFHSVKDEFVRTAFIQDI